MRGSCLLLALLALPAPIARAEIVTLAQLERLARRQRPALDADAAASRAAGAEVERAKSAYNPTLALRAETGLEPGRELVPVDGVLVSGARDIDAGGAAFEPAVRGELGLALRATLYDFGRTAASVDAARRRKASKDAASEVTAQALTLAVRAAYLRWLGNHELLRLAEQGLADAGARTARVQALVGEGVRPESELSVARADQALVELEHARALSSYRSSQLELAQQVGAPLPANAEPDRSLLERARSGRGAPATRDDPTLRAFELEQQAAAAAVRASEKGDAPVLSGSLSAGIAAQTTGDEVKPFPVYAAGVGLSVPLWDGNQSKAAASVARAQAAELDARQREHEQARRDAHAQARLDADNAAAMVRAAQALLDACAKRLLEAEDAYALGSGSIDAIAAARAARRRAETELILAKLEGARAALVQ